MNSGVEPGPWVKARLAVIPRQTFCVFPTPPLFSHAFTHGMRVTCHDMSRIRDHVMT